MTFIAARVAPRSTNGIGLYDFSYWKTVTTTPRSDRTSEKSPPPRARRPVGGLTEKIRIV